MIKIKSLMPGLLKLSQLQTKPVTPGTLRTSPRFGGWPKTDVFMLNKPLGFFQLASNPLPRPQLSALQTTTLSKIESAPPAVRKHLDDLRGSDGFKKLNADGQVRALQVFLDNEVDVGITAGQRLDNTQSFITLLKSPGFAALPPGQHSLCVGTFERAGVEGRRALALLSERSLNGTPTLATVDSRGTTLSTRLALLSMSRAGSAFLDSTLKELLTPDNIGKAVNTQTQATQQRLARENPAELVRILEELTTQGTSTLADGRTTINVKPAFIADFRPLPLGGSSPSAGLFQRLASDQNPRAFFVG